MKRILCFNPDQNFTPAIASLPEEGPVRTIPLEILTYILFLTNDSERNLLVSHYWKDLTFTTAKNANSLVLKQSIQWITEKLNPDAYSKCIADLAELQKVHQSLSDDIPIFAEIRQLFLISKSLIIGLLRKLPEEERDQLQIKIGDQLPDSMKDLIEISKLDLESVDNVDLDTYSMLLKSYQTLSIEDRGDAVLHAAEINSTEYVEILLANGPISEEDRGAAVCEVVARYGNLELVELLLANGPISEDDRGMALQRASRNNDLELITLLLANGPVPQAYLRFTAIRLIAVINLAHYRVH
jgi:hypothetical protein